jgi:hypothetical protein
MGLLAITVSWTGGCPHLKDESGSLLSSIVVSESGYYDIILGTDFAAEVAAHRLCSNNGVSVFIVVDVAACCGNGGLYVLSGKPNVTYTPVRISAL